MLKSVSIFDTWIMFNKESLKFLGINDKECKILECIKCLPKNIFQLSKETSIPRATIYPLITKLYDRKLVNCIKLGNRFVYLSIQPDDLVKKLDYIANDFGKVKVSPSIQPKKNWLKKIFKR